MKDDTAFAQFDPERLVILLYVGKDEPYEIDLEECTTSDEIDEWATHLKKKSWSGCSRPDLLFLHTLNAVSKTIYGIPASRLFKDVKKVNWHLVLELRRTNNRAVRRKPST